MKLLINIDVPDIERGIAFYTKAFDLQLKRLLDDDVAELVGASSIIYLLKKDSASKCTHSTDERRRYSRHWTPAHIDFVVEDIERAATRVVDAGAIRESERVEWRGSRCITFADPFGNGFCLIEFEGGTYV